MKNRATKVQTTLIVGISIVGGWTQHSLAQCEVTKLVSSDASTGDNVYRVSISGKLAAFGVPYEDNGGRIYIFEEQDGFNWSEVAELYLQEFSDGDRFGASVAIDGDTVIGAWLPFAPSRGAVSVYQQNIGGDNNWSPVGSLSAADGVSDDGFGLGIDLHGDTAVIGAYLHDSDGVSDAGAAYVFERNEGGPDHWGFVTKLVAPDAYASDGFGWTVAINGDTIVVGKMLDDELGPDAGAAYVFGRDQGGPANWGLVKKLIANDGDANDWFGHTVAIAGNTIAIGAVGVYDDEPGAVYVFERDLGGTENWGERNKLTASDAIPGFADQFGRGLGLDGDTLVVTALRDNYVDDGKAFVFQRDRGGANNWGEVQRITPVDLGTNDYFGTFADLSGSMAVIASTLDDNEGGIDAGSAYIFAVAGDCNSNGAVDACEILNDVSVDENGNGNLDACDDSDNDGVFDSEDKCPATDPIATLVINDCDTGVDNHLFEYGCSMLDLIKECEAEAANHGQYVRCVGALARDWRQDGLITSQERASIVRCVARIHPAPVHTDAMRMGPTVRDDLKQKYERVFLNPRIGIQAPNTRTRM